MTEAPTNDFALLLLANRDRFHSGFGFRARLENLALSDDDRGRGRRLLRDNRASLRRSVLDDVELLVWASAGVATITANAARIMRVLIGASLAPVSLKQRRKGPVPDELGSSRLG